MIKEIRVNNKDDNLPGDAAGIVVGDEGCIYRLLDEKVRDIVRHYQSLNKGIRLLTPFIPNKFMGSIYKIIEELSSRDGIKITFNDYGLLHKCSELIFNNKITAVLGRSLTRSIVDCPWHKELFKHEDNELTDSFINYSFLHQGKHDVLRDYNIKEIEINVAETKHLDKLSLTGLDLTCYFGNNLISIGRLCFSARLMKQNVGDCINNIRCLKKKYIGLDKMWGRNRLILQKPPEAMKEYFEGMYLSGNIVYKKIHKDQYSAAARYFKNIIYQYDV